LFSLSTDLHPDYLPLADATFTSLVAAYPRVDFHGVRVYHPRSGVDRSLGYAGGGWIYVNAYWFAEPRARLDAEVARARTITPFGFPRWHGGIGSLEREPERLFTHEFGHLLAAGLAGYRSFADGLHRAALDDPDLAVSGYALCPDVEGDGSGADELWADTFGALRLGGSGSPQVAELQAFLDVR